MDIRIIPPTNKDIFLNGKGTLICEVTEKKGGFEKVIWLDEDDVEVVSTQEDIGSNVHQAKIEITFDEWSKGLKRVCEVHSTEWIDTVKREYQRNNGKKTVQNSSFTCIYFCFSWQKTLCEGYLPVNNRCFRQIMW